MTNTPFIRPIRNLCLGVLLSILSIVVTCCAIEAGFRVLDRLKDGGCLIGTTAHSEPSPPLAERETEFDAYLGWRATPGYRYVGERQSADGSRYPVVVSQNDDGFRRFGDVRSARPKLLVIGDSFTQAIHASDNATYYAILGDLLKVEVFAYGVGGYGTLQEYMILDRYFDFIKPDVVLWQFSSNDFINNSMYLERHSTKNNNGLRRPYWQDGKVVYYLPKIGGSVRTFAHDHSRLLSFVFYQWDRILASSPLPTVEADIAKLGGAHPEFAASVRVTDELMAKVKRRVGTVPLAAFSVDDVEPYTYAFNEICRRNNITRLEGVGTAVAEHKRNGFVVNVADSQHWNEVGHRVAGETLAAEIRRTKLLETGAGEAPTDDAVFLSQTPPPGRMVAGQRTSVTVTMLNTGSGPWTRAAGHKLGISNATEGGNWGPECGGRMWLEANETILPGQSHAFSCVIQAPETPGQYKFQWQMVHEHVRWFGQRSASIVINIVQPAAAVASGAGSVQPTPVGR